MHQKTWVPCTYVWWGSKYQSNFRRLLGRRDFLAALNCKRRQLYVFNLVVVWKEGVYYKRCYLLKWVVIHQVKRKKWLITRLIPLLSMSWCDSSLNEAPSRKKTCQFQGCYRQKKPCSPVYLSTTSHPSRFMKSKNNGRPQKDNMAVLSSSLYLTNSRQVITDAR